MPRIMFTSRPKPLPYDLPREPARDRSDDDADEDAHGGGRGVYAASVKLKPAFRKSVVRVGWGTSPDLELSGITTTTYRTDRKSR